MTPSPSNSLQRLQPGQFLNFRRPRRLCLRVVSGTVWVTIDGRLEDIVLERGEGRLFDGGSPLIATAIGGSADLKVSTLAAGSWRARIAQGVARVAAAIAPAGLARRGVR